MCIVTSKATILILIYHLDLHIQSNSCNLVLRKQARKLENDIDMKLVAYSKIGTSTMPSGSSDTAPLLNEHVFDSLSMEIEQMLEKVCNNIV